MSPSTSEVNKSAMPHLEESDDGVIELGTIRTETHGYEFSGASDGVTNEYREIDT